MKLSSVIFQVIRAHNNKKLLLRLLDILIQHQVSFMDVVSITTKNKVRLPFLLSVNKIEDHPFVTRNQMEINRLIEIDKKKIDHISKMKNEIDLIKNDCIYIKGAYIRNFYEYKYYSEYYRFSNDIDILFLEEVSFWKFISNINANRYIQDESLYIATKKGIREFITVHYKKEGTRIDLHCLGFPLQLFRNLEIDFLNERYYLENAMLILLAHSVSHEIITIRDLLDFDVLIELLDLNTNYFRNMIKANNLELILQLYLKKYESTNKNRYDNKLILDITIERVPKKYIFKVLNRGSYIDVLKIRWCDFVFRKIITHTNMNRSIYKFFSKQLMPKDYDIKFLINRKHFDIPEGKYHQIPITKVFDEKKIVEGNIRINDDVYIVNEDLLYEL